MMLKEKNKEHMVRKIVLEVKCSNLETAFHLLKKNCCDKSRQRVNVKHLTPPLNQNTNTPTQTRKSRIHRGS